MPLAQKSRPQAEAAINSRDNRWLKRFRAALRGNEIEDDIIGLEGPHLVEDALSASLDLPAILSCPAGEEHLARLRPRIGPHTQLLRTTDKLFESVAATRTPQGIAALAKIHRAGLDDLLLTAGHNALVVALVAVQDPGNVGTAIRAAEGFGASGAAITSGSADPWNQKSLRASSGSALRLPILAGVQAATVMAQLRIAGVKLIAADSTEGHLPHELDFTGPVALFIGNEGAGLPGEVLRSASARVRIPLAGRVESLNAAVAASVLLYEAARQRNAAGARRSP